MEYLVVGKIIDTFSLDGSVKIISSSTNETLRFKEGNILYIKDEEYMPLTVLSHRKSSNTIIVHFKEVDNVDSAIKLKGKELLAIKDEKELEEGYFFYSDLVGCKIISDGKELGSVVSVEEFPAQVTLRAKAKNGKEFFVPFIKVFIKSVDIKKKEIDINYMEGLL